MSAGAFWYAPAPSEISSSRLSLDFGLRASDLFFRELVVPELGSVWFVRQLSWPVAALALHAELKTTRSKVPRPSAICHGLEALACKLEFDAGHEEAEGERRILGKRAFARDAVDGVWAFAKLSQPQHYVRNTHRQSASRALQADRGLGFVSGARFDLYALEPVGLDLAARFLDRAVGQGGTSLRKWMLRWIDGDQELPSNPASLRKAISPWQPSPGERTVVRSRLLDVSTSASETRRFLAQALGTPADLPDLETKVAETLRAKGREVQARELLAARAFGAVLDRARDLTARVTELVEGVKTGIAIGLLAKDKPVAATLKALRTAAQRFAARVEAAKIAEADSRAFAAAALHEDPISVIRSVVARADDLLMLADGEVIRGPLFRVVSSSDEDEPEGAAALEPDRTQRSFRAANLHSMMRDLRNQDAA